MPPELSATSAENTLVSGDDAECFQLVAVQHHDRGEMAHSHSLAPADDTVNSVILTARLIYRLRLRRFLAQRQFAKLVQISSAGPVVRHD